MQLATSYWIQAPKVFLTIFNYIWLMGLEDLAIMN